MIKTIKSNPLLYLIIFSFSLRFALSFYLPIVLHGDQTYQTLEPAHYLAFGKGFLTWEWHTGIRSWVYPSF